MTTFHDDPLADLLGNTALQLAPRREPPASYVAPTYTEPCSKCRGSGNWRPGYQCFTCKGTGRKVFRTSPDRRANNTARATARRAASREENVAAFKAEFPAVFAWMDGSTFAFAVSLLEAVAKHGSLTDGQMAAAVRCVDQQQARAAADAARVAAAPTVAAAGIDRLKDAFDAAARYTASRARGLRVRSPKINIGGMVISPAKANSKNPGALYVKQADTYLGKIANGHFYASRACTPEQQTQVLAFVADPAEAAKVYGQETGVCCICNATLRSEWRLRGIGPICAEKFGW